MWLCPNCGANNVNFNEHCANYHCRTVRTTFEANDSFDKLLREIRLSKIVSNINQHSTEDNVEAITIACLIRSLPMNNSDKTYEEHIADLEANPRMTDKEKLHAKLFFHEKMLVKDMDTLTLRAHIEELERISFEAKARTYSALDEEKDRRKKKDNKGFETSLTIDETSSNAINTIKERQTKLTKKEKVLAGLKQLYEMVGLANVNEETNKVMSARNVLDQTQKAQNKDKTNLNEPKVITPVFNPFEKK